MFYIADTKIFFYAAVLTFLLFVCGCNNKTTQLPEVTVEQTIIADDSPCYGETIIINNSTEPAMLNPVFTSDVPTRRITSRIFNGLLKTMPDNSLKCDLAESYSMSADGKEIKFSLLKDVSFHDGHILDAGDVLFTWKTIVSPDIKSPFKSEFERINTIEIHDSCNFTVKYNDTSIRNLRLWTTGILPEHIFQNEDILTSVYNRFPVGTGPFRIVEWTHGERLILKRFPDYFAGKAFLDSMIFRFIPDDSLSMLMLRKGDIDIQELNHDQYFMHSEYGYLDKDFYVYHELSEGHSFAGFNFRNPVFQDPSVRKALALSTDYNFILKDILHGYGVRLSGPYNPSSPFYDSSVEPISTDTVEAVRILQDAGYSRNNGIFEKNGQSLSFKILINSENEQRRHTAHSMKKSFEDIGCHVTVEILPWNDFRNRLTEGRFDVFLLTRTYAGDPDIFRFWHSSQIPDESDSGYNYCAARFFELDTLLEKGMKEQDYQPQIDIYREVHRMFDKENICIFLYVPEVIYAISRRIRGIDLTGNRIFFKDCEKWFVPSRLQKYSESPEDY